MIADSLLTIKFQELTPRQWRELEGKLSFVKDNGDAVICFEKRVIHGDVRIPRGAWYLLPDSITYKDRRVCPPMPKLKFALKLDDEEKDERFKGQSAAVKAMLEHEQGLIVRPPGTGKTQIALAFAARCKTRTLVITHTEDILQQWVSYAKKAVPDAEIGIIRGKTVKVGHITIATVQTLNNLLSKKKPKFWRQFGAVIADEAHHVSAPSWERVLNNLPARYRFGFTASPTRADGMHPTMRFIIGPIIHRQKFSSPVKLHVKPVKTGFRAMYRGPFDWGNLVRALIADDARNSKIARIADREVRQGNSVLVLSRRIEHLERIGEKMECDAEILAAGRVSKAERKRILEEFRNGDVKCVLATQLADEALDVQRLNRVLLVHPGKHEGRIIQQIGRAIRQHPDKQDAVIYDFVDNRVGVLRRQWGKRKQTYKTAKISVRKVGKLKWR